MPVSRSLRPAIFACVFSLCCVAIHEGGHILAAVCCGGRITEFVLFSLRPHVHVAGAFTRLQDSYAAAAGSSAEILLFVAALLWAPRSRMGDLTVEITGTFAAIELLGWSLVCLSYPHGYETTDVWKFINSSGAYPPLVFLACTILSVAGAIAYRAHVRARF